MSEVATFEQMHALPRPSAMPSEMKLALRCHQLHASYGRIGVCFDISVDLYRGETLVLLGPNGAGKSSLLGAIAGTVQSKGEISLDALRVERLPAHQRAKNGLAFVPEIRGNLFPSLTVADNLRISTRMLPKAEQLEVMESTFGLFPVLRGKLSANAGMLSGGEQQMLAIGMALGLRPKAILLDEPTQGLAPSVYDTLQVAFDSLRCAGLALFVAEQNLLFAARIATRFLVISHGRQTLTGGAEDLRNHDLILSAYMDEVN